MLTVPRSWRRHGRARDAVAYVQLNHGRWIILCPFCPSAAPDLGRDRFCCYECHNAAAGGRYVDVERPRQELAREILRLTAPRPVENRNWLPGEPVEMLVAENVEHGIAA